MESDVQVRHRDQTRHRDVRVEAGDQDGLQVTCLAFDVAAPPEEGVLWVWMQIQKQGDVNPDGSRDNHKVNFMNGQTDVSQLDNDTHDMDFIMITV